MSMTTMSYDVGSKYGLHTVTPQYADTPITQLTKAAPAQQDQSKLYHPDHPLFAFGVLVGITAGLLAFSGSVRVGKATAKASIGETT